ncbi:MAG: endonuclease III [Dysgonamonadaceae bacterium]|jgi:endonuclease-3|nr:endonuclease III [Dysgonamonadaceae bacterium]
MTKQERYNKVIEWFRNNRPAAETELNYSGPFQLLISVILSAQCTDKRVNLVTPPLFKAYPTPEVLAAASPEAVFEYIKSISYPNSKSKYLVKMAQMLIAEYNGRVPDNVNDLMRLPGVGKKTANVIASVIFYIPALAVDTHVFRVSNRIGLTNNAKTTLETEKTLTKYIPKSLWSIAHHWLILHGRYICMARKPRCEICNIRDYCKYHTKKIRLSQKT